MDRGPPGDRGIRLVEVDVSPTAYMAGHIPGAVLWNAYADLRDPDYQPVARGSLEQLIARSGIEASSTIVVYGYGAALGFWLLTSCGFKDVRMLDGPRDQWSHAGGEWATGAEWPQPSRVGLPAEESSVAATRDEVLRAIGDPNTILVDVRSELEYAGERFLAVRRSRERRQGRAHSRRHEHPHRPAQDRERSAPGRTRATACLR